MRLGLNGSTIMHTDLVTELTIADRAGFEIAELRDAKLRPYLAEHPMSELQAFLKTVKIKPVNINALEPITFVAEKDWDELLKRTEWFAKSSAELGCQSIPVVPGIRPPGVTRDECFAETVRSLKRLMPVAEDYGVGLAFEFIGFNGFTIQGVAETLRVIEAVNRPRIGMVFDFIHFYTGEYVLEELQATDSKLIDMVHLDDALNLPLEVHRQTDGKRLLPGQGIMNTDEIMNTLVDIGYDGDYSIEIYNEDIWNMDPVLVANDAYKYGHKVLDAHYPR